MLSLMARNKAEVAQTERFDSIYDLSQAPVMQAVTDEVCDCGYIGTSWTTREEANAILGQLALDRSSHLLELGAGAGWPGLFLAKESGCQVTLVDLPQKAIRLARERAEADGIATRVKAIVGDAASLTFAPKTFTAINHSDLLCCLVAKRQVLAGCRRVLRSDGRMAFSVISVAPGLSDKDRHEAIENGPPFVESDVPYCEMLEATGWRILARLDMTVEYENACERMAMADMLHETELLQLLGAEEFDNRKAKWNNKLSAIRRRLTLREFFVAAPA